MPPLEPIPGWRASGSLGPAQRFVLRIPARWNGRLVVAGTPAQRSEFACDRILSDPLLARGYAYASGNKGQGDGAVLLAAGRRLAMGGVPLPRLMLPDGRGVVFWQHAPGHRMEGWLEDFLALTQAAQAIVAEVCGRGPELTYAVGVSNGGYQVRRAIEESDRYAGALAWNAVLWTPEHNLLNVTRASAALDAGRPEEVEALGFPPDVRARSGDDSLYRKNQRIYWQTAGWLHAVHLDPRTSLAYGDVRDPEPAESWQPRLGAWEPGEAVAERIRGFANTGRIRCKLIDLASEYDHFIPPAVHLAPYRALVAAAGRADLYRSDILPNAQHVDTWSEDPSYPRMRPGHPRVLAAFDELVAWVEGG